MNKLKYYVLDVFTTQRYSGNQLSVVHCDYELGLNQYHAIAKEFGYSETSFIHYSREEHALKVRSFTPSGFEVVGAGHNLLGAVCLPLLKGWDIFNNRQTIATVFIKDIPIPILITVENGLPYVAMKQQSAKVNKELPPESIAPAIGLSTEDLNLNEWKIKIVETEAAHLMIPVKNVDALHAAVPNKNTLKKLSEHHGFEGFYLFTTNVSDEQILAETRFFNPGIGIDEDPATGTAAGPLTGYLEQLGFIQREKNYKILQGVIVDHPSTIHTRVSSDGIWVSGSSVIVMEGDLYL